MHREAWEEMMDCADCGATIDVARERGYRSGGEWALCWACALARGARFDEEGDRWDVPPDPEGLPAPEESRVP